MYFVVFVVGMLFGSFGSVLLMRLEDRVDWKVISSILFGFSRCPHCKKRLRAKHLIPLGSFLWQQGKCAFCKASISWQYPLLEFFSGLMFVFAYYLVFDAQSYFIPEGMYRISFVFWSITHWGLLLLLVQDIKKQELHMPIWLLLTVWILLWQFFGFGGQYQSMVFASLLFLVISALIYFGAKVYLRYRYSSSQEGFGQGDMYLAFTLGALIPFVEQFNALAFTWQNHLKIIFLCFFLAAILGLVYAGIVFLFCKQTYLLLGSSSKITIPFFPTLILAFWILLVYGDRFVSYFLF